MRLHFILFTLVSIFIFGGCSSNVGMTKAKEYTLWEKKDGSFKISSKLPLRKQLSIAAKESKKRGYSYFVLLNAGVNNMNGFPINTYSELTRYITLHKRKPSFQTNGQNQRRGNIPLVSDAKNIRVWFKPVGKEYKNSFISVWSVSQNI